MSSEQPPGAVDLRPDADARTRRDPTSERRLHPVSLLFTLGEQLRAFVIPALLVFITSRGLDAAYLIPLGFVGIAAVAAFLRWFSFRFRYGERELIVRSGVLFRNERHIPYERIQNLDVVQKPAHRLLRVATVHVQTGGGQLPEATLNVLPMDALAEMRERIAAGHAAAAHVAGSPLPSERDPAATAAQPADTHTATTLLHLSTRDLLLGGFIENRGMFLILTSLGVAMQFGPGEERVLAFIEDRLPWLDTMIESARQTIAEGAVTAANIFSALAVLVVLLLFIRILSMVWAAVRLHDYRLTRDGDDLRAEYGLLTRVVTTIPLRRIQMISIDETLLHRWLGLAAVRVTTAGGGVGETGTNEREGLAPIIPRDRVPALLERVQPGLDLAVEWRPIHPRAFRRIFFMSAVRAVIMSLLVILVEASLVLPVLALLLVRALIRSRLHARHLGWGMTSNAVVFRGGWMRRRTSAVRFSRLQSVAVHESPFDRRTAMASVSVDAAGRGGMDMPYLPRDAAADLRTDLAARAAVAAFTW